MARRSRHEIDMTDGPILGSMLRFALPLMLSSILQLAFNAADVIVVSRFAGDECLAAVGSTGALTALIVELFVGLSIGANVAVARALGARDNENVSHMVHTSMLIALISGVFITILGVFGARYFLELMDSPADVIDLAVKYLRIYSAGMIATMVYNFGSAILRAIGDTKRPLYFLFTAGVINVILNLVFVICFGMDVDGVAWATVISQAVSAVLVVICLMRSESAIRFNPRRMRIHGSALKEIARIGLPAGLQGILFSISNVMIQSSINAFGSVAVAGNSAASNIGSFVYGGISAFYQAATSFTSQNMGAKRYDRIWKIVGTALACDAVASVTLGIAVWLARAPLMTIYTSSPDVIAAGSVRITCMVLPYIVGCSMDVFAASLRGIGYSLIPMIVSVVGVCAFRVFWLTVVCRLPAFSDLAGIYISYPVSWTLTLIAQFICFVWAMRRIKARANQE